jgi:hypothetical protein
MTKAAVLDTSLQRTHEWLHEIGREIGFDNEPAAYAALRATLHAVRDRLPASWSRISVPSCRCWCAGSITRVGIRRPLG